LSNRPKFCAFKLERLSNVELVVFDFDGVFTNNKVYVNEIGEESVQCSRLDGIGLAKLKQLNIPVWVLSTEINPVVSMRCKKLDLPVIQGSKNKIMDLKALINKLNVNFKNVLYLGNDINDLECLSYVGLPFLVSDAHPDVIKPKFAVTQNKGGDGAVREICDLISYFKSEVLE